MFLFADDKKSNRKTKKRKKKNKSNKKLDASQIPIYNTNSDKNILRIRLRIISKEPKIHLNHLLLERLLRSESLHNYDCCYSNHNMSLSSNSCDSFSQQQPSPSPPINISIITNIIHPHLCQQDVSDIVFISQTRQQSHSDNNKALIQSSESKNDDDDDDDGATSNQSRSQRKFKSTSRPIQIIDIIDKNEEKDETLIRRRDVIDDEKIDNINNKIASSLSSLSCPTLTSLPATTQFSHDSSSMFDTKPMCDVSNDDNNNNNLCINNSSSSSNNKRQNLETQSNNRSRRRRNKKTRTKKSNGSKRRKN